MKKAKYIKPSITFVDVQAEYVCASASNHGGWRVHDPLAPKEGAEFGPEKEVIDIRPGTPSGRLDAPEHGGFPLWEDEADYDY